MNKNKISEKEKNYQNNLVREKIKKFIHNNKNHNLRELSRILERNDAYLQQYIFRKTPKFLPEEYRLKLAKSLNIDINEITPNWLKKLSSDEKFIRVKNIDKYSQKLSFITFSQNLLTDIEFKNVEDLFFFQTEMDQKKIVTIIDVSINEYLKPDLYLLNDKNNYFLAYIILRNIEKDKVTVKPYLDSFYPFHINKKHLNITARVIWQSSKIHK